MTYSTISWHRKVPVRYEADVVVLGGGMAGISAAIAAAKSGVSVILVEKFAVTGGNATIGGVAAFCGETAGQGEVFDEVIRGLEEFQAIVPYRPYPVADHRDFRYEILAVVLQEMLLKHKVRLLLHTQFIDVQVSDDGRIQYGMVSGKSGPEFIKAKQFIDCTGEGQVAYMSDFATMKGREKDGAQLPMSMMCFMRHVNEQDMNVTETDLYSTAYQIPPGWFEEIRSRDELPMVSCWPDGPNGTALKIKVIGYDATDTESMTAAEIDARRKMMQILDYYQRVPDAVLPNNQGIYPSKDQKVPWQLDHCSPQIGIREGRRIVGDYILTLDDLRQARQFDDAIARGTYYLDAHSPDTDKREHAVELNKQLKVPPYHIPFRALIARDGKNLLAAGRCFSAEQLALSSARVMPTASMLGQAAGIAAAVAVEKKCDPRDLDYVEIRKMVVNKGANLDV